jgi:hypothetical protein
VKKLRSPPAAPPLEEVLRPPAPPEAARRLDRVLEARPPDRLATVVRDRLAKTGIAIAIAIAIEVTGVIGVIGATDRSALRERR